ncbi:MAG: CPBP family intramembrane glutamic endopeptidase [Chitinophagaceae bacterium]
MQYKSVKGYTGWSQLGIITAFTGFGMVLAAMVQYFFALRALGPSALPWQEKLKAGFDALMLPGNENYAQLTQVFGTMAMLFLPALLYVLVCHKHFFWVGFNKQFTLTQVLIAFGIIFIANYFAAPFEQITKSVFQHFPNWDKLAKEAEELYKKAIGSMSALKTWPQFFVGIFIVAFLPALFEELFFRGVLQNLLVRWWKRPLLAILFVSIVFSLIHASYYLFLSRLVLGFALGLLFHYSQNLWVSILAHFINNLLALTGLFYTNTHPTKTAVGNGDTVLPIWSLAITGTILVSFFIFFKRQSFSRKTAIIANENQLLEAANPFAAYE